MQPVVIIPARSTSPQNDLLFEKLSDYIEARCLGSPESCKNLCPVYELCDHWFSGVSDLSGAKHPLTNDEFWRAIARFEEIRKRAGKV